MVLGHFCQLTCAVLLVAASLAAAAGSSSPATTDERGLQPQVEKARGSQCVDEPAFMRRNHMKLLTHQRNDTLRGGIRTGKYSLKACVACHASQTSQSVNAEPGDFCQSCHNYAAVKIDCFECHANTPEARTSHPTASEIKPVIGQSPIPLAIQQVKP